MRTGRKIVKDYLKNCSRADIERLTEQLYLSDEQLAVLRYRLLGKSYTEIAISRCCDISTAKRRLAEVYDKIYNVISH